MKTTRQLFLEVSEKIKNNHESSGSAALIKSGRISILKKMFEEAAEVWMACKFEDNNQKALEISQYLYYVILYSIQSAISNELMESILSEFETGTPSLRMDQPNKQLIYLTTELTIESATEREKSEIIRKILSVITDLIDSNNLTKTDIYKKL